MDDQVADVPQPTPATSASAAVAAEPSPEERAKALFREADALTAAAVQLTQKARREDRHLAALVRQKRKIVSPSFVPPTRPVRVQFRAEVFVLDEMRFVSLCDAPYSLQTQFSGLGTGDLSMGDYIEGIGMLSQRGRKLEVLSVSSHERGKDCDPASRSRQTLREFNMERAEQGAKRYRVESKEKLDIAAAKRKQAAELLKASRSRAP